VRDRPVAVAAVLACLLAAMPGGEAGEPAVRTGLGRLPPSQRALVDARVELRRRHREVLFRADTTAGAERAAEVLLEAGAGEPDRALKWLLFDEARRLGVAAGNALVVHRAVTLASATYDFDALDVEHRSLEEIPLRGVSPQRAVAVAETAEGLAARAEADGRLDLALSAQDLAIKAWQRAGAVEACRRAMTRHAEMTAAAATRGER